MDKITLYQDAITELLEEYISIKPANMKNIDQQLIADRDHNHFAFIRLGWEGDQFIYQCVIHFDIKDGKVWLQQNRTDQNLIDELIAKGVNQEDIIIGFVPPYARTPNDFAKA